VLHTTENPYFAMNEAYGAESMLNLSTNSKLKLTLQTGENGLYGRDYEQDRQKFDERSYAVGAEYSFNLTDYLELATMGGMLYEEDAILGLNGRGGLAIRDGSTYYMGLKAKLNLTSNVSILAAYYRGYTAGQNTSLMSISDLETESFMLAGEYQLNRKEKFGLSLS
jgi:long-subunit fatty acid transport protein